MGNNLKLIRNSMGLSQEKAAAAMGTTRNQYVKLEGGSRRLSDTWIDRAAKAFNVDPGEIVTEGTVTVPLVGYVGAGAETNLFGEGQGPFDMVEAPDGSSDKTVAVEIRGESLGPWFDRWLIFYDNVHEPPRPELLNKLCIVGLPDGRILAKKLMKGSEVGCYTLLSQFESPLFDTHVEWAAKVKAIIPKD